MKARNNLVQPGVKGVLGGGEGVLVLGKVGYSFLQTGYGMRTGIVGHGRDQCKHQLVAGDKRFLS